jgi:hypothetical protein
MRARLLGGVGVALGLWACAARAEEVAWRPIATTSSAVARAVEPTPAATLLRPVPVAQSTAPEANVTPVGYTPQPAATFGPIIRAQAPDVPAPGTAPVQPVPPINDVLAPAPVADPAGLHAATGVNPAWLNGGWLGTYDGCAGRACLQSDHCFDYFISPVTDPFRFEDPRSLTEIRPIFIWQQTPTKNGNPYHGGDIEFFGIQARAAITERLSVTMTKLGWTWQEVHDPSGDFASHSGFSEIQLGAKYTFLRQEAWGTLGAFGLTFEVPVGDKQVFQDTGTLSLRPYLSFAQNFCKTSYGSFNAMMTTAGSFAVDNKRSDYFYTGLHLDYDVANLHKIYPLMELNWTHYTSNGQVRDQGFEGRDLFNFGATGVSGHNSVTFAVGARYKFREWLQTGIATEWAVAGKKDLQDFRLTWDVIFRY